MEGFWPINWTMSLASIKERMADYHKAVRRKPPEKEKCFVRQIVDELTVMGWISIPCEELDKRPSRSANIPKSLRKYSLSFFYFHPLPLFEEEVKATARTPRN